MVNRIISTKIPEKIHDELVEACNKIGCAQSDFLREAIEQKLDKKENEHDEKQEKKDIEYMTTDELRKALGLKGH